MIKISYKLVHPDAKVPTRAHGEGDSCWDLYACEDTTLRFFQMPKVVKTGIEIAIPVGWGGFIWDRSGNAVKHGVTTRAGVIDASYRNEIGVVMINEGADDFKIKAGDRIAQIDFRPIYDVQFEQVDELDATNRSGGFGSSGR